MRSVNYSVLTVIDEKGRIIANYVWDEHTDYEKLKCDLFCLLHNGLSVKEIEILLEKGYFQIEKQVQTDMWFLDAKEIWLAKSA